MDIGEYADNIYPSLLNNDEKYIIKRYSSFLYRFINMNLRQNKDMDSISEIITLDRAINKFKYDRQLIVYRNIEFDNDEDRIRFLYQLESGVYQDKGYLSTSISQYVNFFGRDFRFMINIPEFCNGACIRNISANYGENEYLLSRNTKLEIIDIKTNEKQNGAKILVKARVIK